MAKRYEKNTKGMYPCPYCEHESPTPQGIGKHVQKEHGGHAKAAKETGPRLDLAATGFNGDNVAQAAAGCAEQKMTGRNPDRIEQTMTTQAVTFYPPLTQESLAIRNVCNVAVAFLTDPSWRKLTAERKRDVLAVMRMRLAEEMVTREAILTGDMMGGNLDPLSVAPA